MSAINGCYNYSVSAFAIFASGGMYYISHLTDDPLTKSVFEVTAAALAALSVKTFCDGAQPKMQKQLTVLSEPTEDPSESPPDSETVGDSPV